MPYITAAIKITMKAKEPTRSTLTENTRWNKVNFDSTLKLLENEKEGPNGMSTMVGPFEVPKEVLPILFLYFNFK